MSLLRLDNLILNSLQSDTSLFIFWRSCYTLAKILLINIMSNTRVGPFNQWGFSESTPPYIPLIQVGLL